MELGRRVDYIDYLKGLSIIWVVWYHTVHPWFVDFSFRMPLFFLASGIFFKIVDIKTYVQKKANQLLVPFVVFTIIYYVYLILQCLLSTGSITNFDFGCIWGVFEFHRGVESFVVNPPLWFICALLCLQLTTWLLVKLLKKRWLILSVTILLTIVGVQYVSGLPTLFMFGRSIPYLVYYVCGHLYGKDLIKIIESDSKNAYWPCVTAISVYVSSIILKQTTGINPIVLTYFETFGLIVLLVYLFKTIHKLHIAYPFWFYGRNSYIVLGMHEIYLTIFTIVFNHVYGAVNIWSGILLTLATLIVLWPTIRILNKYVPQLVGKAELISFSKIKTRIISIV